MVETNVSGTPPPEFRAQRSAAAALVVPLARLTGQDQALAGGKAANLGEMLRASLPVPGGFCVTTAAFGLWLDGSGTATGLLERLAQLAPEAAREIREAAAALRQGLSASALPRPVEDAIRAAVEQHGPQMAWAVRSSATAEDLPEASFAGQHDSLLNVRGSEAVLAAVRRCWVSLFTDRAVFYRLKNRIPCRAAAMAVVVQEMVPAEVSGVIFTADPLTGDTRRMVIEGAPGLGEALVSGRVSPDRLVLDKETLRVLERTSTHKKAGSVPNEAGASHAGDVNGARPHEPCFNDAIIRRLGELARHAERLFGRPQDMEWAARGSQVFLLQSRPITAWPPARAAEPEVWTNANVVEALPDVVTPMSWSLLQVLLQDFLYPLMRRLDLNTGRRPLVDLIAGRAYMNVRAIIELVQKVAGPIQVDVTVAFGGLHSGLEQVIPPGSLRSRGSLGLQTLWRFVKLSGWLLPGLIRQQRLLERWGQRVFGDLARRSPARLSDEQLADHPLALLRLGALGEGDRTWAAAIWMAAGAVGGSTAVFHLAGKWLGDTDRSLANRLLGGATGMSSAENGLELLRLAAWARQHPELKQALLEPVPFAVLENKLPNLPKGPEFLARWRTFMACHGHQARGGMDIFQPRWSELPDFVLDMLRVYLRFDAASDPLAVQARQRRERETLLAACRQRLRNPLQRWLFTSLVRLSRRGLAQRENVKNAGVRLVACLRRAVCEAGRRLVERRVLRQRDDVFYLRLEELRPVLCGRPTFDVAAVIAARKAACARDRLLSPPPVIVGRYDPDLCEPVAAGTQTRTLQGLAVSPGLVTGRARVIDQADAANRVQPGEILVAPYTDPGWTPYFLAAAGLVVDVGGLLSHGSVVAREYGLPAVVNVGPATKLIKTGQRLQVDGHRGVVTILD
ncbi:MAG: PEP/pyruvate-binding domain-containing protein [Verrucomicrobiota bacterium]